MLQIPIPTVPIPVELVTQQWDAASVILVISALGTMLVSVVASISAAVMANRSNVAARSNGQKADTLIEKATEIHTLTNSNLSKVTSANEVLTAKVDGLMQLVQQLTEAKLVADRVADTLAATTASRRSENSSRRSDHNNNSQAAASAFQAAAAAERTEQTLSHIDENTAATAANTAVLPVTVKKVRR